MRLRHGFSLLAASLLFHTASAWSLGLGDARVESFIGQPLEMRIDLLTSPSDDLESVTARLASAEDFALIGASRGAISVPLRFNVREGEGAAGAYILVTSRIPLNDPVLRLVVEVNWASGRLLREYTVFLDPPTVPSQAPAPATSRQERAQPQAAPATREPAPVADSARSSAPPPEVEGEARSVSPQSQADTSTEPVPGSASVSPSGGSYGPVRSGETLWRVASDYIGQSTMDMNQVMLAIQRKNPNAFVDDNINLLMRGANLEMPTQEEIESTSRERARELVAQQEAAFRMRSSLAGESTPLIAAESRVASSPVDSADTVPSAADGVQDDANESQARLEIVPASEGEAAEPGTGAVPGGEGADEVQRDLREELARTEEELISERQQNEYLRERISELEARIDMGEGTAEGVLPDDELSDLEDRLRQDRLAEAQAGDGEDAAPEPVTEEAPASNIPSVTTGQSEDDRPWYSGPVIWLIMIVILVAAVIGWLFNRRRGQEYDLNTGGASESVSGLKGEAEEILRTLDSDREAAREPDEGGVVERRVPEAGQENMVRFDDEEEDFGFEEDEDRPEVDEESHFDPADDDDSEAAPVVPLERARRRQDEDSDATVLDENSSDPEIKLDLARAYISMGDKEAARVILDEVLTTGDDRQKSEARSMMDEL